MKRADVVAQLENAINGWGCPPFIVEDTLRHILEADDALREVVAYYGPEQSHALQKALGAMLDEP